MGALSCRLEDVELNLIVVYFCIQMAKCERMLPRESRVEIPEYGPLSPIHFDECILDARMKTRVLSAAVECGRGGVFLYRFAAQ
jgi:hypothetical protein